MNVAVTGASGYLGQLILPLLDQHAGVDSILGLDIVPSEFASRKYRFRRADMRTADFEALLGGVDVLFHLAFVVEPPRKMSVETIDEINIAGTKKVIEGAVAAGTSKIVVASSIAAYGAHEDNPEMLTEASPLRPNRDWYYSRAKGEIENLLDDLQARHLHLAIIRFRPSTFLGPSIRNPVGDHYASRVLIGLKKGYRVDHCWDEDVARAFVLALDHHLSAVFNLAGENPLSLDEAGKLLGKKVLYLNHGLVSFLVRVGAALGFVPPGLRDWVDVATKGSILVSARAAREQLGWRPRFDSAGALLEFARQRNLFRGKDGRRP
jgi:UDP-glucose 4-epimerase